MSNILKVAAAGAVSGPATDPNFNQTVLLLHGDGTNGAANNTFLDSSTNNFTITRAGTTTQGTFSPFSLSEGQWSAYTNGTAQDGVIRGPDTATLQIEGDDFNLEAWVYLTSYPPGALGGIFSRRANGATSGWLFYVNDTGKLIFGGSINGTWQLTWLVSAGTVPLNQWCHVCVSKESTTVRLFIDGTLDSNAGTLNATSSINSQASSVLFAVANTDYNNGTQGPLTGYISNARVIRGTALYTSSFTVPTTPLTTTSQGATSTEVELLTCQSNRFVDNSDNAFALTTLNTITIQPFSPFAPSAAYAPTTNGGSGYFDGSGDYLTAPDDTEFDLPGDYTMEGWYYTPSTNSPVRLVAVGKYTSGSNGTTLYAATTSRYLTYYVNGSSIIGTSIPLPVGQWSHVAVVREGASTNNTALFLNGVRIGQATNTTSITGNASNGASIGAEYGTSYNVGQIMFASDVRIVKGTALYDPTQTTITIPTAPLTAVSGTSLLCNFTNAGIIDNSGKHNLFTANDTQLDTGTKKYGTGSIEFDGSDYLASFVAAPSMNFSGDFSIELWVNFTTATTEGGSNRRIFGFNTGAPFEMVINTNGTVFVWNRSTTYITSGSAVNTGNWVHLALTRESNSLKLFVDGTQSGSTATVSTNLAPTAVYFGANPGSLGTGRYLGFMDDIRFTTGVARYTTTFIPPTKALPDL